MNKTTVVLLLWLVLILPLYAGKVTYVYTDPQGTPLAEADGSGNVTATFDYRPYGPQTLGSPVNGPGYTGHVNDPDSGLIYMQHRYYDPVIGRFISVDPVSFDNGDMRHFGRYTYAYGNPVTFTDPDGRCPLCIPIFIGISLFTVADNANAPGPGDTPAAMSAADKLNAVASALPPVRSLQIVRFGVNVKEKLGQRAASREAKRQVGIPTSQQPVSQTNGRAKDGTPVGRQQTYEVPKEGGGTEVKSVQVSRDVEGSHAGMTQIEAGTVKPGGQLDQAGRPRLQNETKVRVDFDRDK